MQSHVVPWNALEVFFEKNTSRIEFPTGKCDKIHVINKTIELQIQHRLSYICPQKDVCHDKKCKVIGTKTMQKSNKKKYVFDNMDELRKYYVYLCYNADWDTETKLTFNVMKLNRATYFLETFIKMWTILPKPIW